MLQYNLARTNAQLGRHAQAIEHFNAAIELDPNYSESYNERGAVYFGMGLVDAAERDYRHAIELSPLCAEAWTNLGQCLRAMGRMEEAVSAYSRALGLDPSCALALTGRADAHSALEHAGLALADYGND